MLKFRYQLLLILFIIAGSVCISSCGEEESLRLSNADNKLIDSIFFSKKDSIIKLTDSLCEERYGRLLSDAIDSIKQVRRQEIESILSRS